MAVAAVSDKTVLTRYVQLRTVSDSITSHNRGHGTASSLLTVVRRNANSLKRGEAHATDMKCGLDSDGCFFYHTNVSMFRNEH